MEQFIEGLKKIPLSKRTQERIKLFKENIHQIYHQLDQPRPYFIKHSIIGGNSIKFIEQDKEQLEVGNKGVIVGRIYKVLNPSKSLTDNKNLRFKGSCFFVTNYLAVCCSHQVMEDNKFVIRIDGQFILSSKLIQIDVKKIYHNSFEKARPGEQKSQDYAFLNVEMESWLKNSLRDNFTKTLLTTLEGIENLMFNFDATIFGYFEKIPKQFQDDQKWLGWRPDNLIKSSVVADYSKKELSYTVSTDFGFSGAPIVLEHKGKYHIVGFHTRGSHFYSKNYGILFNQTFFLYLQQVINELLKKEKGYKSLQQTLNIVSLASIVQYKKTLKDLFQAQPQPNLRFIQMALKKIIQKIAQLEESELVVEQLSLQDIIISRQQKDDFLLDFSRLRLSEYIQKGNQVSNLDCISLLIMEIEAARQKPLLFDCKIGQMKLNEEGSIENRGQQGDSIIAIIQGCLSVSYQQPLDINYKKTKFLLDLITFVPREFSTIQQFFYQYYDVQFYNKCIHQTMRDKEIEKITQMTGFNLNQHMFRKKFMNLMKYSQEKLSDYVIARTYLAKLCSFYNQLRKVIEFFNDIAKNLDIQIQPLIGVTRLGIAHQFQSSLKNLLEAPTRQTISKFAFLNKNFIFQEEGGGIKAEQQIRNTYMQILKSQKIPFSQNQIDSLTHYQYMFCSVYANKLEIFKETVYLKCIHKDILLEIQTLKQKDWQQKRSKLLTQGSHPLKRQFTPKPFSIYETKIFKEIFIEFEHTAFRKSLYNTLDMSPAEDQQYEEILNILVEIRDKDGKVKGTGFFLDKDTVCTTRRIFEGKDLSSFLVVSERVRLQAKITSAEISLDKKSEIIFLKVEVKLYNWLDKENEPRKLHFSNNIFLMDNDLAQELKQFEGKNNIGLLIGLRKVEGSNQIRPTKSYGQIQMNSKFQPLIGKHHLSGSPIIMRITKHPVGKEEGTEYEYAIVGIYAGVESVANSYSSMQRFIAKSFNVQGSFLKTVEFRRLSECVGRIKDQRKQFIESAFSSLDHFLLRVMGQILRLNSLNIYLEDLNIHNILFGTKLLTDIEFSSLPIRLHIEYLNPNYRKEGEFEKIKIQLERKGTKIFSMFMKGLLNNTFNKNEKLVFSSVLMNQLQTLEKSGSLAEFYNAHLQGKYFFDKESCTLRPLDSQNQQIILSKITFLPQESKFQKIFKSGPAERLARLQLGYSLLKNTQSKIEDIMQDNREFLLCKKYLDDRRKLLQCMEQKTTHKDFFYLAKKILQDTIKEMKPQSINSPSLQNDEIEEFESFKGKYLSYIKDLTSFSNLNIVRRNDFKIREQSRLYFYYKPSKRWNLICEILDLFNSFQV